MCRQAPSGDAAPKIAWRIPVRTPGLRAEPQVLAAPSGWTRPGGHRRSAADPAWGRGRLPRPRADRRPASRSGLITVPGPRAGEPRPAGTPGWPRRRPPGPTVAVHSSGGGKPGTGGVSLEAGEGWRALMTMACRRAAAGSLARPVAGAVAAVLAMTLAGCSSGGTASPSPSPALSTAAPASPSAAPASPSATPLTSAQRRKLARQYLAVAGPANKALDHEVDAFDDARHDDLARA